MAALGVALSAVVASPLAASIRPEDQQLAERFNLTLNDLGSGLRSTRPGSTKVLYPNPCPSAPRLERFVTGFAYSPSFSAPNNLKHAAETTRVFASVPLAKRWFDWSEGGELAKCTQAALMKMHRQHGYKVSDLRRRRESMTLDCSSCPKYVLRAWRMSHVLEKPGDRTIWFADNVSVRLGRVTMNFLFEGYDRPFTQPGMVVASVLEH